MKYKLVIFDLDGTLLDTRGDIARALNMTLKEFGIRTLSDDIVGSYVGNGAYKLVERSVSGTGREDEIPAIAKSYRQNYQDYCLGLTRPFPGVVSMLEELRSNGIKIAVNSNKPQKTSEKVISALLPGLIDHIQGQLSGVGVKPDPAGAIRCMTEFGILPSECCFVGDSEVDIMTGTNAGVDVICVDWGFKTHEFLAEKNAPVICSDASSLTELLLS
ncbi:MAG: HAD-IA family hydrolase [Clostridiales bacterium]|nr:HAD-IA family hydrolase [Clostridiales bacterium]